MKRLRLVLLLFCALPAIPAVGQVQAYDVTGPVVGPIPNGDLALGVRFTPTQNIWITSLGWWDPSTAPQPLPDPALVGIYSPTNLVVSATIPAGTIPVGAGEDSFAWSNVGPVELTAGTTYTLEGIGLGNDVYAGGFASSVTTAPGWYSPTDLFGGSGIYLYGPSSLPVSPDLPDTAGYYLYAGPNFEFTATPPNSTPEPGAYALFGSIVLTGAAFLTRRRSALSR